MFLQVVANEKMVVTMKKSNLFSTKHPLTMQKFLLSAILLVVPVVVGCSGPKGLPVCYVEGIVTLDGKPLDGALISFYPAEPGESTRSAAGYSDASGKYTLTSDGGEPQKGALEGDYVVTISKQLVEAHGADTVVPVDVSMLSSPQPSDRSGRPVNTSSQARRTDITPKIYSDVSTSPLRAIVKKGKNDIPFDIKSK